VSIFGDDGLAEWLHGIIESDLSQWRGREARLLALRRQEGQHRDYYEAQERVARLEADLAILDLYEKQAAKEFDNAMEEDRTWTLSPVVRLLGHGYRFRSGYREAWKP
jgi:hypothetical protein